MIHTENTEGKILCNLSGDSKVILSELLITVSQVLKAFHAHGCADVVMQGLVDVADDFASSINDTNFHFKGEEEK